jgi:hypothetical protein
MPRNLEERGLKAALFEAHAEYSSVASPYFPALALFAAV